MTIRVGPNVEEATHHIKLTKTDASERGLIACTSDGKPSSRGTINRSSVRGSTVVSKPAQGRFDDRQPPYTAIEQSDWSGGRGKEDWDRNTTRFQDSGFAWTATQGRWYPAPLFEFVPGIGNHTTVMPRDDRPSMDFYDNNQQAASMVYVAVKFTQSGSLNADYGLAVLRKQDTPATPFRMGVFTDSAGEPNAISGGWCDTVAAVDTFDEEGVTNPGKHSEVRRVTFSSGTGSLADSTDYWMVFHVDGHPSKWLLGYDPDNSTSTVMVSTDASTWVAQSGWTGAPYFALFESDTTVIAASVRRIKFEYQRALYMIESRADGSSANFYLHADRGVVDSATANSITDASKSWANDAFINGTLVISGGTGKGQERLITDSDGTSITVDPAWDTNPSTDSDYVIQGGQAAVWQEITGLSPAIANVSGPPLISNEVVYFPQGNGSNFVRFRAYNNAGTWTRETATETGNESDLMILNREQSGTMQVYRSLNSDANGDVSISRADLQDWGTDLTFGDPIRIGDNNSDIKNILSHDGYVWVIKEDGLWAVLNDVPDLVLDELKFMRSDYTGQAAATKTPYLYYTMAHGLEEFFGKIQQDMGPNRDDGLPPKKQGPISALQPHAKYLFAAVDSRGVGDVWSTVQMYNGAGWHEIFRAPNGERIRSLHYQVIPYYVSRLWVGMDHFTGFIQFPTLSTEPRAELNLKYHWDAYVAGGWMADNLLDIPKHWAFATVFSENLDSDNVMVLEHRDDDDTRWTEWTDQFITSPTEQNTIGTLTYATGNRLRFRSLLRSKDATVRPEVQSLVLDYVGRFPTGFAYDVTFLLSEQDDEPMEDLQGDPGDYTAAQIFSFLEDAVDDPLPLTMNCVVEEYDSKTVLVDPTSLSVNEVTAGESRILIARVRLIETQV